MTMVRHLLASAAFLLAAGASAYAAGELPGPPVAPDTAPQIAAPRIAHPPAVSASPPIKFLWRLLVPKTQKEETLAPAVAEPMEPAAPSAPMVLVPQAGAEPDRIAPALPDRPTLDLVDKPRPKSVAARSAVIPIPRPRPPVFSSAITTGEPAAEEQVDFKEITGSISTPQPKPAPPPAPQPEATPSLAPELPSTELSEILDGEDLLPGDPARILGEEKRLVPEIVEPEGIDPLKPATGAPSAGASPRPGVVGQPYELMRTLQVLQDQIAQGSTDAHAAQRILRAEIDRSFAAADPVIWQDRRNAVAAVNYVLSGGPPAILRKLETLDPKPAIDPRLISGVLAYAEGDETEANRHLAEFDVARMQPSMGAQLALAKSALAVRTDPAAAMRFLSIARLLAPGTLVEEAALRREIFVADRLKDAATVEELARQYLARFRNSIYAGNFRNRFAAAVSRMNFVKDQDGFSRIEDLLLLVEPESRGQLYLTVALAAVVKGNSDAGAFAADRALALAPRGSREEARAQLYRAASMVVDAKAFDAAVAAIDRSNRDLLGSSDQSLHDAVAATIAGIRRGTEVAPESRRVAELDLAKDGAVEMTPLMSRARDALAATDEVAKGMAE